MFHFKENCFRLKKYGVRMGAPKMVLRLIQMVPNGPTPKQNIPGEAKIIRHEAEQIKTIIN